MTDQLPVQFAPQTAGNDGWARGVVNGRGERVQARGSWSIEPALGEGFLFHPRDWTMDEHHAVCSHLQAQGWHLVDKEQFVEATPDGQTVIRLLCRDEDNPRNDVRMLNVHGVELTYELSEQIRPAGQLPWRGSLKRV